MKKKKAKSKKEIWDARKAKAARRARKMHLKMDRAMKDAMARVNRGKRDDCFL